MKELTSTIKCPAFPAVCTYDVPLTKKELLEHLYHTHGIAAAKDEPAFKAKRKRETGDTPTAARVLGDKDRNVALSSRGGNGKE